MKSTAIMYLMNLLPFLLINSAVSAQENRVCASDYDVSSIKNVVVDKKAKFVKNEIEIIVDRPIAEVYKYVVYTPLEEQLHGTKKIPGVRSTRAINNKNFGTPGYRRVICLEDDNTVVEEFIENVTEKYFYYKVWNYTLKDAQVIDYATGEFWFTPIENKTHIKWRYSFKLDDTKFLGKIGCIGRWIFKTVFIKAQYNEFMVKTLNDAKIEIEKGNK